MSFPIVLDHDLTFLVTAPPREVVGPEHDDRIPWSGEVVAYDDGRFAILRGLELGRTTILVVGERLPHGHNVTLTLELEGERVYILASVEWSALAGSLAVSRLRLGVTSPRANDLIARLVRRPEPREVERAATDPIALDEGDDEECQATGIWQRP